MNKNSTLLKFEAPSSIDQLSEDDDVSIVSIDILHEDENEEFDRNLCRFSHDCVKDALPTLANRPLVFRYDSNVKELVSDVTGHSKKEDEIFNSRVAGHIPSDSRITFVKRPNGKTYVNCEAIIQKRYLPQLSQILKERDGTLDVSIEICADGEKDKEGIYVVKKFKFLSVCLLGRGVLGGMQGAKLNVLKFSKNEINDMNERYMKFSQDRTNGDIFEKIKYKIERKEVKMELEHKKLEQLLWADLSKNWYESHGEAYHKYYIEAIYKTHIIVRNNEDGEMYKFKYRIDENGDVSVDYTTEKPLEDDLKKFELCFAKDEIGTEPALKVDKSADAISDSDWGSVDKAELKDRVIKAKNFKTIANDVFLDIRDGGLEGESSKLKYPVMEIKDGTLVYNRAALASAKAYATKNDEKEVLEKLKKIYSAMKLDFELDEEGKVMMECGGINYETESMPCEDIKTMEEEDKDIKPESEDKEEPHAGEQEDKDKKDEKDDEETRKTEVAEDIKTMSTDANVDPTANVELLKKEAEQNKDLTNEGNPSLAELDMEAAMSKIKEMESELDDLRKFKADSEKREKSARVASVMADIGPTVPADKRDELLAKSEEFELKDLTQWENLAKALAFEFGGSLNKPESIKRMSVWGGQNTPAKKKSTLWGNI